MSAVAKKGFQLPPAMTLDMRGRLVADKRVVFNSTLVKREIDAVHELAKELAALRARKRTKRDAGSAT